MLLRIGVCFTSIMIIKQVMYVAFSVLSATEVLARLMMIRSLFKKH